jgi:prepilin-type N-terminal cleavage/methylation domain-containing protein
MRFKSLNNHGYTLIEIVMVIVILGIVGGITFQVVAAGVQAFKKTSNRKDLYDQGRLALERMAREIRDAKELVECWPESITFKKQHPSQDSVEEIKFWLDGANTLWRVRNPSTTPLSDRLASNVDSFQVANENCSTASGVSVAAVTSGKTASNTASSMTVSHTTGSGSYRLMLVGISVNVNDDERLAATDPVTYGGTPLSKVGERANSNDAMVYIYSLVAPTPGTADVVITFDSALDDGALAGVMTFTGVDPDTPLGNFYSAQGDNTATASVNIADTNADELVFGVVTCEYDPISTAVTGQDVHWNTNTGNGNYGAGGTDSGASPTMTWGFTVADPVYNHWATGGVSIKPSGSGGGSGPAGSVVSLELTLSSEQGGEVSMRTMTNMRNVP